ncbi:MAG: enoyl-CoA hydratase [Cyanobacteria bacterium]|nr:enoyl-CoA hydratase [Cyanobacteriota bacterium]
MTTDSTTKIESKTQPILLTDRKEGVLLLTLNRPASRNSLSAEMMSAVIETMTSIENDESVRVVVLASSGPVFCAGHDLKELTAHRKDTDGGLAFYQSTIELCSTMMQKIVGLPQPVIAAVQGVATAAGCQLVATCDLAVAGATSKFATPGVNIGLFCSTPMVALSRNLSAKHAMEMLLTGDFISAEDALSRGLINRIVEPGTEVDEARSLATKIAEKSPYAVRIGKRAFYKQAQLNLAEAYSYASEVMVQNLMAHDADEGICAFLEKRPPNWNA